MADAAYRFSMVIISAEKFRFASSVQDILTGHKISHNKSKLRLDLDQSKLKRALCVFPLIGARETELTRTLNIKP